MVLCMTERNIIIHVVLFFNMTTLNLCLLLQNLEAGPRMERHCCHAFSLNNFIYMTFTYIHIYIYTHIHIYIHTYTYIYKVTIHKILFILTWVHVFVLYYIRQSMLTWLGGLSWCFQVFSKSKLISHIN